MALYNGQAVDYTLYKSAVWEKAMEYCKHCGEPLTDSTKFCPNCGKPREAAPAAPAEAEYEEAEYVLEEPEEDSPQAEPVPVTNEPKARPEAPKPQPEPPQAQPPVEQPPVYREEAPAKKKASKLSVWAFVLTVLLVTAGIGFILAFVDLVKKDRQHKHGLSVAALVICGILGVLAFIGKNYAMPQLLGETSATSAPALTPLPTLQLSEPNFTLAPVATLAPARTAEPTQAGDEWDICSGTEEYDLKARVVNKNWTYRLSSEGFILYRTEDGISPQTPRILLTSTQRSELPESNRTPEKVLRSFMTGLVVDGSTLEIRTMSLKNGYTGYIANGVMLETYYTFRGVAWYAVDRFYLLALVNPANAMDADGVFYGILDTFEPVSQHTLGETPAHESAQALSATHFYSEPETFDMEFDLTNQNWKYVLTEVGIQLSRPGESGQEPPRIYVDAYRVEYLSSEGKEPSKVLFNFLSFFIQTQDVLDIQDYAFNNGFSGVYTECTWPETGDPVRGVAWQAGERIYLVAAINIGNQQDVDDLFTDIVNSFRVPSLNK